MSQAVRDLPDPLEPTPTLATSSPDDLLSRMADEAIDQLMADADKGTTRTAAPILDEVDEVEADEPPPISAPKKPVAAPNIRAATDAPTATDTPPGAAVDASHAAPPSDAAAAPAGPPEPAADVKALLADAPLAPSPLLWPLRILNLPFAGLSDPVRATLGWLGLVTLVPAICAIVYVLFMKHR